MQSVELIPANLRLARVFNGLTQADLGARVGVTHTFIGLLESGARQKKPTPLLLEALASVLGFGVEFFSTPLRDEFRDDECHFRKRQATPVSVTSRVLAHGSLFATFVDYLDGELRLPKENMPAQAGRTDHAGIEWAAQESRRLWGLDADLPIKNLCRTVERAGVVVTRFQGDCPKVDAFSRAAQRLIVVLNSDKGSASRSRFDLAHEAGHLVLHRGSHVGTPEQEDEANRFASALLLPQTGMLREFPRGQYLSWEALLRLKARWKVSVAALVRRAYDLHLIDAATYHRAYKAMSAKGWLRGEPEEFEDEQPEVLQLAMAKLSAARGITASHIARELRWSDEVFSRVTGISVERAEPLPPNVVPLRKAKGQPKRALGD